MKPFTVTTTEDRRGSSEQVSHHGVETVLRRGQETGERSNSTESPVRVDHL